MNHQIRISKWLETAGFVSPKEPTFPRREDFRRCLSLILEELIEGAESGNESDIEWFSKRLIEAGTKLLKDVQDEKHVGKQPDVQELRDAISDLRVVHGNLVFFSGLTEKYDSDMDIVLSSNETKYCTTIEEAQETVNAYSTGTHPDKPGIKYECYYKLSNGVYPVYRTSDDKIMKSINYIPVKSFE